MRCSACKKELAKEGVWARTAKDGRILLHYDCEATKETEIGRLSCEFCGKSWKGSGWAFHLDGQLFHRGCRKGHEEGVDLEAFKAAEEFHQDFLGQVSESKRKREENVGVAVNPWDQHAQMIAKFIKQGARTAEEIKASHRPGKLSYFRMWSVAAIVAWADRCCLPYYEYEPLLLKPGFGIYSLNPEFEGRRKSAGRTATKKLKEDRSYLEGVPLINGILAMQIVKAFNEQPDRIRMTAAEMTHYLKMKSVAKMEFNMARMSIGEESLLFAVPNTHPREYVGSKVSDIRMRRLLEELEIQ